MSSMSGESNWKKDSLTLAAFDNQADLRIGFRFVNGDGGGVGADHCFGFDQVDVQIPTVSSPPVASFAASSTSICQGDSINFSDSSTNTPTSWAWSFPGGTPDTSNLQNPTDIIYATPGTYNVTLFATNGAGTDDSLMTGYITVDTAATVSAGVDDTI